MVRLDRSKVNEERQKWINYLRSDDIGKMVNKLEHKYENNRRCCLGHACHVLGLSRRIASTHNRLLVSYKSNTRAKDSSVDNLPVEAQLKLNLDRRGQFKQCIMITKDVYGTDRHICNLQQLNDKTDLTLSQIADIIEEQLKLGNFVEPEPYMKETRHA